MKKTAKIILVSAGAAMLMAGGVLGAVAVYDTANPRSSGDIVVKTEHVNLVWGEDGEHENTDAFEVAITDLNTTATDRYLTVAIEAEEGHTLAAGTYKGTLAFSIVSSAKDSMILPKLAVEVAENGTDNKVSIGADYKANLVVELTEQKTSALVKISYKLTENFGELTQEELTALAAEKLTATADWNIYSETPAPEPVAQKEWYLVGSFGEPADKWKVKEANKLVEVTQNVPEDTEKQYKITKELAKDVEFKIRDEAVEDDDAIWSGDLEAGVVGMEKTEEGNIKVTTAGTYDIYFKVLKEGGYKIWAAAQAAEPSQDPEQEEAEVVDLWVKFITKAEAEAEHNVCFAWLWTNNDDGAWYEATYVEETWSDDYNLHYTISAVGPVGKNVVFGLFDETAEGFDENPGANWAGKIKQSEDYVIVDGGANPAYANVDKAKAN